MRIKTKFIDRHTWRRIVSRRDAYLELNNKVFDGYAGLLCMDAVTEPLIVTVTDREVCIVDNGYSWMQIAPQNEHWWLTVMFDERWEIVQYYFDVTLENILRGRDSRFRDLFLDVAAIPGGPLELLDRDELDEAYAEHLITAAEHHLAVETADRLVEAIPEHWTELYDFCMKTCRDLREEMGS